VDDIDLLGVCVCACVCACLRTYIHMHTYTHTHTHTHTHTQTHTHTYVYTLIYIHLISCIQNVCTAVEVNVELRRRFIRRVQPQLYLNMRGVGHPVLGRDTQRTLCLLFIFRSPFSEILGSQFSCTFFSLWHPVLGRGTERTLAEILRNSEKSNFYYTSS